MELQFRADFECREQNGPIFEDFLFFVPHEIINRSITRDGNGASGREDLAEINGEFLTTFCVASCHHRPYQSEDKQFVDHTLQVIYFFRGNLLRKT